MQTPGHVPDAAGKGCGDPDSAGALPIGEGSPARSGDARPAGPDPRTSATAAGAPPADLGGPP